MFSEFVGARILDTKTNTDALPHLNLISCSIMSHQRVRERRDSPCPFWLIPLDDPSARKPERRRRSQLKQNKKAKKLSFIASASGVCCAGVVSLFIKFRTKHTQHAESAAATPSDRGW